MPTLFASFTVLFTIVFSLIFGITCGYAVITIILRALSHQPEPKETAPATAVIAGTVPGR